MSSFNKKSTTSSKAVPHSRVNKIATAKLTTKNKAGGQAFNLTAQYKLAFALVSSFLEPEFYRSRSQTVKEIEHLVKNLDPLFCARAAVFVRKEYGNRATTHLVAAVIAHTVKGEQWTKNFFASVVHRVDDAAEILAAYISLYGKPIPNSLKKGLAMALGKFSEYQLAKYKGENKGVKLVDLFNIVHPKPNKDNNKAFKSLIEGTLVSVDTWESMLSAAGQKPNEKEKNTAKREVWWFLIKEKKLGYFALLRNLRNIMDTNDRALVEAAIETLTDKAQIHKSLVMPFRYLTAQKELEKANSNPLSRLLLEGVNNALDTALENVPKFNGQTLIALDCSGSMGSTADPSSPASIGSLFAAVIAKVNNADMVLFDDAARPHNIILSDSIYSITKAIQQGMTYGGTDFNTVFSTAKRKYDRIIILSDMQAWVGHNAPLDSFKRYCTKYKANPNIYCFDLSGYGTIQFPQEHVFALAGFSEKTMDVLKVLEQDKEAFIKQIDAVTF